MHFTANLWVFKSRELTGTTVEKHCYCTLNNRFRSAGEYYVVHPMVYCFNVKFTNGF